MTQPTSLEAAFTDLLSTYGRTAHGDGPEAARKLALAVADEFAKLLHDPPLGQANDPDDWTSDDEAFLELRARIAALGEPEELNSGYPVDEDGLVPGIN